MIMILNIITSICILCHYWTWHIFINHLKKAFIGAGFKVAFKMASCNFSNVLKCFQIEKILFFIKLNIDAGCMVFFL